MTDNKNSAISRIINSELIRQFFGYWPAFHDAEITKVTLEANPGYHASVTFVMDASQNAKEVDEKGYYNTCKTL